MYRMLKSKTLLAALLACCGLLPSHGAEERTLEDLSTEHAKLILDSPDGGIPPLPGVHSTEVYHATHELAADTLGKGYTYNHHVDMAVWKGRFYLAWTNGERDEDIAPAREVYLTSQDGMHWSKPAELFPEGTSTSMRMYFFKAPNGRMLTTAGIRTQNGHMLEKEKGGLLVREIRADHSLGQVFTIIPTPVGTSPLIPQPIYSTSPDAGFVEACRQLLSDSAYLEQQDLGVLLGEEKRMAAYRSMTTPEEIKDFGRAPCFYRRKDGAMIGIGKLGYSMISHDDGKTFAALPRAESLATGDAKIWVQQTSDGRYAMVHNPKPEGKARYPLVVLSSDDGMDFRDMRLVNGEIPFQRYKGAMRAPGLQYTRGVSIFADDGTLDSVKDLFVAYSANKEDIVVSRIPVPLKQDATGPANDRFENSGAGGRWIPGWNIYSPLWSPVAVVDHAGGKALSLTDGSPFDFSKAERVFQPSATARVAFTLAPRRAGDLEIELRPAFGLERPVKLALAADGKLTAFDGPSAVEFGTFRDARPVRIQIDTDCANGSYRVTVDGREPVKLKFSGAAASLCRIEFRTGPLRPKPERNNDGDATGDKPLANPAEFLISDFSISPH